MGYCAFTKAARLALFATIASITTVSGAGDDGGFGADVLYSDINGIRNWGAIDGVRAYSLGSVTCNIGDADMQWGGNTPLLAMNAYRLHDGRLLQIGMSWVKNGVFASAHDGCGMPCNGNGGDVLGAGCRDVYSAQFNGGFGVLGPRSQVDPFTGAYPGASGGEGDVIHKRLQVAESDSAQTEDDAIYFVEGQHVAPDDAAAGNAMNNASYKRVIVAGAEHDLVVAGPMHQGESAIFAWRDHGLGIGIADASVQIVTVDVPDEGRFHVASKVTPLEDGRWRYDYAVRNFNSHLGASGFAVAVGSCVAVEDAGFHDVAYHSGESYDGTDWAVTTGDAGVAWATQSFDENPMANALRWGTMYNFWFESVAAPGEVDATIDLFRSGGPASLTVLVQGPVACAADIDGNGAIDADDMMAMFAAWGECPPDSCPGDLDENGTVNVDDLIAFFALL